MQDAVAFGTDQAMQYVAGYRAPQVGDFEQPDKLRRRAGRINGEQLQLPRQKAPRPPGRFGLSSRTARTRLAVPDLVRGAEVVRGDVREARPPVRGDV